MDDSFGVFVDGTDGADTNPGTKTSPVQTITEALGKLDAKSRVYIASGTYAEHVTISSAVSLYGGFTAGTWGYAGAKAAVAPSDAGTALMVLGVPSAVTLSDLSFTAQPGSTALPSSVGALVSSASSVTFRRVAFTAGKAFHGTQQRRGHRLSVDRERRVLRGSRCPDCRHSLIRSSTIDRSFTTADERVHQS